VLPDRCVQVYDTCTTASKRKYAHQWMKGVLSTHQSSISSLPAPRIVTACSLKRLSNTVCFFDFWFYKITLKVLRLVFLFCPWSFVIDSCSEESRKSSPMDGGGPSTQQPSTSLQSSRSPGCEAVRLVAICRSKPPNAGACWLTGTGTLRLGSVGFAGTSKLWDAVGLKFLFLPLACGGLALPGR